MDARFYGVKCLRHCKSAPAGCRLLLGKSSGLFQHLSLSVEVIRALSSVLEGLLRDGHKFHQVVVKFLTGQSFRIVVVVSHVPGHSTEGSTFLSAVTLPGVVCLEVPFLSNHSTIFISEILLNMVGVDHVRESCISRLFDVPCGLEWFIAVVGRLSQESGIAHLHFTSVSVSLTFDEAVRGYTEQNTVDCWPFLNIPGLEVSDANRDISFFVLKVLGGDEHVGLSQSKGGRQ